MKKSSLIPLVLCAAATLANADSDNPKSFLIEKGSLPDYASAEMFHAAKVKNAVNIGGLWATAGMKHKTENDLLLDIAGILAEGNGKMNYEGFKVSELDLFAGAQLGLTWEANPKFSVTGGIAAGLNIRYAKIDDKSDTVPGFFYGAYLNGDLKIDDHWSVVATGRYIKSTVENDFGDGFKIEKPNYWTISAGLKYSF